MRPTGLSARRSASSTTSRCHARLLRVPRPRRPGGTRTGWRHILEKHVTSEATALARAKLDNEKISVFNDLATAQRVVDNVLAAKAAEISKWLRGGQQQKTLRGSLGGKDDSLGFVAHPDGTTVTRTGNQFVIILKRAPGHKPGRYYVYTGYPV
ncbi:RNase A-like domain-containing protein [Streptomyces sp. NPDC056308]|uniref:RNase A-like domain-containing protein n=1 Tax=Streptomyces sp. NPDC056308 TaxID=3345780 RepID=UPI0035DED519